MKVLLIQPLHEKFGGMERQLRWRKNNFKRRFNPPLGLLYIASVLLKAGHKVKVWDIHGESLIWTEIVERIKDFTADLVGISALSSQYLYVKNLVPLIKKYLNVPIIVGNTLATYSSKLLLEKTEVDFCVIGEGESTIIELVENLRHPDKVSGIAFRDKSGKIKVTPSRKYIRDLKTIPFPAYHLLDMSLYAEHSVKMVGAKTGNAKKNIDIYDKLRTGYIISGRGCPYRCRFCSRNTDGVRMRDVENVINEIEYLKENFGVNYIHFGDELFVLNKKRTRSFCKALKNLKIKWDCQGRINLVDRSLLFDMKDAGCVTIGFGIESGSQRMLDAMKKDITIEQIKAVMKWSIELDLEVKVQLIFGFPGENLESLQKTIDLFKELKHPGRRMSYYTVLPGTKIYDQCLTDGTISDEDAYLSALEIGGGWGQVLINLTDFSDEEIYPRIRHAKRIMKANLLEGEERLSAIADCNIRFLFETQRARLSRPLRKNEKIELKKILEPYKYTDHVADLPIGIDLTATLN